MVPAVRCDVVIEQGATFHMEYTWLGADGVPIDLTDYTAHSQVRASHVATEVQLDMSSENDPLEDDTWISLGGASGLVILHAGADATRAITVLSGVYDVELTSPGGDVYRLAEGRVSVTREVTR